jgi:hypothetical protein
VILFLYYLLLGWPVAAPAFGVLGMIAKDQDLQTTVLLTVAVGTWVWMVCELVLSQALTVSIIVYG